MKVEAEIHIREMVAYSDLEIGIEREVGRDLADHDLAAGDELVGAAAEAEARADAGRHRARHRGVRGGCDGRDGKHNERAHEHDLLEHDGPPPCEGAARSGGPAKIAASFHGAQPE